MITTKQLCNIIIDYFPNTKTFFWSSLFEILDDNGNYQFYYLQPGSYYDNKKEVINGSEKGIIAITTTNLKENRIFNNDKGTLIPKWIRAIENCQPALLRNIHKTICLITDQNSLSQLHSRLHKLCKEYNLTRYLGFTGDITTNPLKDECIEMVFILFMESIGANLDNSNVTNASHKKESLTLEKKELAIKKAISIEKNYFSQTLYSSSNEEIISIEEDFNYSERNFSNLNRKQLILVEGPGGLGKSLFLKKLHEKALDSNAYEYVLRIELTDLFHLSESDLRQFDTNPAKHILCHLYSNETNINDIFSCLMQPCRSSKRVLLLLDGLNELFTSSDLQKVQAVLDELEYISKKWTNSTIVLTTRPSKQIHSFLNSYHVCTISGTPREKLEKFLSRHCDIDKEIQDLAQIPMYYNILSKLNDTKQIKTKYDILLRLYIERYNQSFKDGDSFFAFFVLAPFIAREIHDSNKNSITLSKAKMISQNLKKENLSLFLQVAQKECGLPDLIYEPDIDNACSILFHNGPIKYVAHINSSPLICNQDEYKIFHDDIRDFLLAFSAVVAINVMKESLHEEQFGFVKDIYLNLNLKDEPTNLFKSKLMITCGKDIEQNLSDWYSVLYDVRISPQAILFAHTLFLISDYLNLGKDAVEPTHNILIKFTKRIVRLVKQNNFIHCLKDKNGLIEEAQQIRCKQAMLDIISKHCEYYRRNEQFIEGIELANIAEHILQNNDIIKNQKGKLLLYMYQSHAKDSKEYELTKLGFSNYTELYLAGRHILDDAASNDFNLSVNSVAMLCSVPAPFLFDKKETQIHFDFIKAFHLCRSLIFTNKRKNYTTKEICYAVRQAIGLLLKGYVKFNPNFEIYEGGNPGANSVVLGNNNTLSLDTNTIAMAKQLLEFVDGMSLPTLNYYRGVIAYYENNNFAAKEFFNNETDILLRSIFQHYCFDLKIDLDFLYQNISSKMAEPKRNVIDSCHPIYWYCDAKNLELSFDKSRIIYFNNFEKELPETWRNIVKQLTQ